MLSGYGLVLVKFTRDGYLLYRKTTSHRNDSFLQALNKAGYSYETIRSNDTEHVISITNKFVSYRKDPIKFKLSYYGSDVTGLAETLEIGIPEDFDGKDDPKLFSVLYTWSEIDHVLDDLTFAFDRLNDPFLGQYTTKISDILAKLKPNIIEMLDQNSMSLFHSDLSTILDMATDVKGETLTRLTSDIDYRLHSSLYKDLIPYMNLLPETWNYVRPILLELWSDFAIKASIILNKWVGNIKTSGVFLQDPTSISDEMLDFMYEMAPDDNVVMGILKKCESTGIRPYMAEIIDDRVFMKLDVWPGQYKRGYGYEYYTFIVSDCPVVIFDSRYLVSSDKGVLYTLSEGDLMPKTAKNTGSCSLMRVTFTMNAVLDPTFLDYLRSINSTQFTRNTWDIPYQLENEVDKILEHIKSEFGYPIQLFQILDGYEITGNAEECEAKVRTALVNIKMNKGPAPRKSRHLMNRIAEKLATAGVTSNNQNLTNISRTMRVNHWYYVAPKESVVACGYDCDCEQDEAEFIELPPTEVEKIWIPENGMAEVVDSGDDSCSCIDEDNEFVDVKFETIQPSDGWYDDDVIMVTV